MCLSFVELLLELRILIHKNGKKIERRDFIMKWRSKRRLVTMLWGSPLMREICTLFNTHYLMGEYLVDA